MKNNISYGGQLDFEKDLNSSLALTININYTKGIIRNMHSYSSKITNYGIGVGTIKKIEQKA